MNKAILLASVLIASLAAMMAIMTSINTIVSIKEPMYSGSSVCARILRASGIVEDLGCNENTWTNSGKNWTRDCIGQGVCGATAFKYLALGNTSAPSATSTTLAGEIADCGLARASGTYVTETASVGNWTIYYTWTSTCNNEVVNTTAVFNATSGGIMLAGTTITSATLQSSDQLQVNYTKWVS